MSKAILSYKELVESKEMLEDNEVSEGVDKNVKINNLKDLEKYLEDKSLPVANFEDGNTSDKFSIFLGLESPDSELDKIKNLENGTPGNPDITIALRDIELRWGGINCSDVKVTEGLNKDVFVPQYRSNKDADFNSLGDVAKLMDTSRLYNLYLKEALKVLSKRLRVVSNMFNSIKQIEDRSIGTLAVTYDKRMRKFVMYYNPDFILEAALTEWGLQKSKFSGLPECYVYTLVFLIAHEMQHLIRNHAVKDDNLKIIKSDDSGAQHRMLNCIEDSFINNYLKVVLRDTLGEGEIRLASGLGGNIYVSTRNSVVAQAVLNKGLKKYDTVKDLVGAIIKSIGKTLNIDDTNVYFYSNVDLSAYENTDFILKFSCWDLSMFENNSANYTNVMSDVMECISEGKIVSPQERKKTNLPKPEKPEKQEPQQMSIKGKIVKDKKTGKRGIVIEDDLQGNIKVYYPDDEEELKQLENVFGGGGM